jgi:mono/diheme cytochrome c family protein
MQVKILIGTIAFMLTMIIFGFAALQEPARLARFDAARIGRSVESGASLYEANCVNCHGADARGSLGSREGCVDPNTGEEGVCIGRSLNHAPLVCGEPSTRMIEYEWASTKYSFIESTLIAGRTANGMPAWSQDVGGPLQPNEIEDLTEFILNFESEELCAAVAFTFPWPGLPLPAIYDSAMDHLDEVAPEAYDQFLMITGEEFVIIDERVEVPELVLPVTSPGDPDRGRELFAQIGCAGCHGNPEEPAIPGSAGPWQGDLVANVENGLRKEGYTPREYLYESIMNPGVYLVDGYGNAMPGTYPSQFSGTVNTPQDLEDIITYLMVANGAE